MPRGIRINSSLVRRDDPQDPGWGQVYSFQSPAGMLSAHNELFAAED
jgi:hypothetical protein